MRSSLLNVLPKVALIIPAAGSGERFGASIPKALVQLNGRTLIEHCLLNLSSLATQIIVAAPAGFEDKFRELLGNSITVVTGGATRTKSVKIALDSIAPDIEFILYMMRQDHLHLANSAKQLFRRSPAVRLRLFQR